MTKSFSATGQCCLANMIMRKGLGMKATTTIATGAIIIASLAMLMTTMMTTAVYAQPGVTSPGLSSTENATTTTMTPTTQQIIDEAHAACMPDPEITEVLGPLCVSVIHESPTTLVLTGNLLVVQADGGYRDNPFIWQAVDKFKAQGYTLNSALFTGEGIRDNPYSWYIVMSKQ